MENYFANQRYQAYTSTQTNSSTAQGGNARAIYPVYPFTVITLAQDAQGRVSKQLCPLAHPKPRYLALDTAKERFNELVRSTHASAPRICDDREEMPLKEPVGRSAASMSKYEQRQTQHAQARTTGPTFQPLDGVNRRVGLDDEAYAARYRKITEEFAREPVGKHDITFNPFNSEDSHLDNAENALEGSPASNLSTPDSVNSRLVTPESYRLRDIGVEVVSSGERRDQQCDLLRSTGDNHAGSLQLTGIELGGFKSASVSATKGKSELSENAPRELATEELCKNSEAIGATRWHEGDGCPLEFLLSGGRSENCDFENCGCGVPCTSATGFRKSIQGVASKDTREHRASSLSHYACDEYAGWPHTCWVTDSGQGPLMDWLVSKLGLDPLPQRNTPPVVSPPSTDLRGTSIYFCGASPSTSYTDSDEDEDVDNTLVNPATRWHEGDGCPIEFILSGGRAINCGFDVCGCDVPCTKSITVLPKSRNSLATRLEYTPRSRRIAPSSPSSKDSLLDGLRGSMSTWQGANSGQSSVIDWLMGVSGLRVES